MPRKTSRNESIRLCIHTIHRRNYTPKTCIKIGKYIHFPLFPLYNHSSKNMQEKLCVFENMYSVIKLGKLSP